MLEGAMREVRNAMARARLLGHQDHVWRSRLAHIPRQLYHHEERRVDMVGRVLVQGRCMFGVSSVEYQGGGGEASQKQKRAGKDQEDARTA